MGILRLAGGLGPVRLVAVVAVATAAVLATRPAWADPPDPTITTVSLDQAGLPVSQAAFTQDQDVAACGIAATTPAGRDVWIFAVSQPGTGQLVSVTASFRAQDQAQDQPSGRIEPTATPERTPTVTPQGTPTVTPGGTPTVTPGGTASVDTPAATATSTESGGGSASGDAQDSRQTITAEAGSASDEGALVDGGAWVVSPAGWELTRASAQVTGDAGELELVAACAGTAAWAGAGLLRSPNPPTTQTPTTPQTPTAAMTSLPVAGTDVVPLVTVGTGLVLAGALLILARGRKPKRIPDQDDDIRQPVMVVWRN